MDFENRLQRAIERGQKRSEAESREAAARALSHDEQRVLHSKYRLELSEHIESCFKKLVNYLPGFQMETIFGERGWGAAANRDALRLERGTRERDFSRLEITVRPIGPMMILEIAIWGAWLPLIWGYMGKDGLAFSDSQIAWVGSAFAIASIVGIFFSSQAADRTFAAEKFMAFSHLVGGLAILGMYWAKDFPTFFGLMLVHALLYVPTISVSNSIAFTHMQNAQKEFGVVRMGGTIGWILAAWPLFFLLKGKTGVEAVEASRAIFLVSGITSLVLAAYSLLLPHTPPKKAAPGEGSIAWLKANPDKASIGIPAVGGTGHLAGLSFLKETGASAQFIPYRGNGPALQDLVAGQIDLQIEPASNFFTQAKAGAIKPYAITAKARSGAAPDIPTTEEAGMPGFTASFWYGIWAPKDTPREIVARLNAVMLEVLAHPETRKRFADLGLDTPPAAQQTPDALRAFQKSEADKWWPIIKAANIKGQ